MIKTLHLVFISFLISTVPIIGQSGFAPESITGGTIYATITSGTGAFSNSGQFILLPASTGNNYTLFGGPGVDGSQGTYNYTKTAPNIAQMNLSDTLLGVVISHTLRVTASSTGSYIFSNMYGSQSGNFSFFIPRAPSTSLSDWKYDVHYPWV